MKPLSPPQFRFVEGLLSGLSAAAAARQAGYGKGYAERSAALLRTPTLEGQNQVRATTLYTVKVAMDELEEAMDFARVHKSAMALSRLIEIRCKLNGLLIDHVEIKSTVDIGSALLEAKQRSNGVLQIANTAVTIADTHRAHDKNPNDLFS
jgi:hypothetical protein